MLRNSFIVVVPFLLIGCRDLQPLIEGTGSESGSDTSNNSESASTESDTGGDMGSEDTSTSEPEPGCGDGVVGDGEECDDGDANDNAAACKDDCTAQTCGDGHVGVEEGCDDGNLVDGDGCSAQCITEFCGDGIKHPGEECDDGEANDNMAACKEDCKIQACGDGHTGPEESCDDGNLDDDDGCSAQCIVEFCGDGIQQMNEACDDGNDDEFDGCTSQCVVDVRLVFVTSDMYTGDLGGVDGADMICNTLALDAQLPGDYKAWISTSVNEPANSFLHSAVPYVLVDSTKVADNWNDLTDGTLDHAIDLTETGQPAPVTATACSGNNRLVRTGTASNGTLASPNRHCNDFTSSSPSRTGRTGSTDAQDYKWTQCGNFQNCSTSMPIYCFQQ